MSPGSLMKNDVTVALCLHKRTKYLPELLQALAQQQTPPPFELLCILNQCSADVRIAVHAALAEEVPFGDRVAGVGVVEEGGEAEIGGPAVGDAVAVAEQAMVGHAHVEPLVVYAAEVVVEDLLPGHAAEEPGGVEVPAIAVGAVAGALVVAG